MVEIAVARRHGQQFGIRPTASPRNARQKVWNHVPITISHDHPTLWSRAHVCAQGTASQLGAGELEGTLGQPSTRVPARHAGNVHGVLHIHSRQQLARRRVHMACQFSASQLRCGNRGQLPGPHGAAACGWFASACNCLLETFTKYCTYSVAAAWLAWSKVLNVSQSVAAWRMACPALHRCMPIFCDGVLERFT